MKIYFCGSIAGGRDDADLYSELIGHLQTFGTVLTEHVGDKKLTDTEKGVDPKYIHDRDLAWLEETDVVVAEVTQTSLGVGYELGRAVVLKKPILCLFRPECGRRLSAMIDGAQNGDTFVVKHYKEIEGKKIISEFMNKYVTKEAEAKVIEQETKVVEQETKVVEQETKVVEQEKEEK